MNPLGVRIQFWLFWGLIGGDLCFLSHSGSEKVYLLVNITSVYTIVKCSRIESLKSSVPLDHFTCSRTITRAVPEACESQLFLKVALLVTRPADLCLLRVWRFLMMKAHRVPACHDVEGDDAAQRVRHYGHFPVFLKVWIPWAEEWVQTIQLQSQTPGNLHTHTDTQQQPTYTNLWDICLCIAIFNCVKQI